MMCLILLAAVESLILSKLQMLLLLSEIRLRLWSLLTQCQLLLLFMFNFVNNIQKAFVILFLVLLKLVHLITWGDSLRLREIPSIIGSHRWFLIQRINQIVITVDINIRLLRWGYRFLIETSVYTVYVFLVLQII